MDAAAVGETAVGVEVGTRGGRRRVGVAVVGCRVAVELVGDTVARRDTERATVEPTAVKQRR